VFDAVADRRRDAVEQPPGLVHGHGYAGSIAIDVEIPFFASTRKMARKARAAIERVMCRA
jgi:hypothetical protein